jgi:hypothetical protein
LRPIKVNHQPGADHRIRQKIGDRDRFSRVGFDDERLKKETLNAKRNRGDARRDDKRTNHCRLRLSTKFKKIGGATDAAPRLLILFAQRRKEDFAQNCAPLFTRRKKFAGFFAFRLFSFSPLPNAPSTLPKNFRRVQ